MNLAMARGLPKSPAVTQFKAYLRREERVRGRGERKRGRERKEGDREGERMREREHQREN